MKTSELLMAAATVLILAFAGLWMLRRLWGLGRKGRNSSRDDDPVLWI